MSNQTIPWVTVPDQLINRIGTIYTTKKGDDMIVTGFVEMPTKHTEDIFFFYCYGVPANAAIAAADVGRWRHEQRLRNNRKPGFPIQGNYFMRVPVRRIQEPV